jgi:D-glycero-D-manno-heptose 1,7-bisphosphate phosphatase
MKQGAVFLDRDGVINRALVRGGRPFSPARLDEVEILPGVHEALNLLKDAAFRLLVVTNQPDVARGTLHLDDLAAIESMLMRELPLDRIYVCPHDDSANCSCRKPRPGLLLRGAAEFGVELAKSFMVGDRWRDIEAGAGVGCKTIFIDYAYQEERPKQPDYVVASLSDAARIILLQTQIELENDCDQRTAGEDLCRRR